LERMIAEGLHIPLTTNIIVNKAECLDIIDRLQTILAEEERRGPAPHSRVAPLEQEPAVVGPVRSYIPPQLEEHELVAAAQTHADRVIAEARKQAETLRNEADAYVVEELQQLRTQLEFILRRVRNGIRTVQKEGVPGARHDQEQSG
jgi:cell division septum initiation protein DivIVA